ncbi:5-formyltetrahydrofolate cyclo-ligase [Camelimonas fluminis]|uniref:5-formyltetrahydrofolate cyclo-ligase n=1 Tax=Camelimonas fluminis TaxID=1576911 RepID=A0ABV7UJU4_9HYPH|nr:5-formyltetrahydrofolate cyclo-ligase [Camelimonas fluminis]GHE59980.1 5-formyltetrahydrofolate cyclo-ligase [Camelimonas fluminis]
MTQQSAKPAALPDAASTQKALLRERARVIRDAISPAERAAASRAIAARFMAHARDFHVDGVVSAYWPIRSEIDPLPLLQALAAAGFATSLPVVAHPTLVFRIWRPGDPLVDAGFGTRGPSGEAPECAPALALVPCLAFDRAGGRLGYGAGHFDRALERLRATGPVRAVALAFAAQEVASAFSEAHDQPLDAIVTERELIRPTRV